MMDRVRHDIGYVLILCLSYLNFLFLIPLAFLGSEDFAAYHIRQGFALFLIEVFGAVIISILDIPARGYFSPVVMPLFVFLVAILAIWGIILVLQGRQEKILWLNDLADRLKI